MGGVGVRRGSEMIQRPIALMGETEESLCLVLVAETVYSDSLTPPLSLLDSFFFIYFLFSFFEDY